MSAPLNQDIALRVGLAAREFGNIPAKELLELLIEIMGEPITQAKLEKLRAKKVRQLGSSLLGNVEPKKFDSAFAFLKGRGIEQLLYPKPNYSLGSYCEIKGSLRVACASDSGENIDGLFSNCVRFLIYQVSPEYIRLIDIREPKAISDKQEKIDARATLLEDCSLLYTRSIGAAAAAKTVKVGLHPIKLNECTDAKSALQKLQAVISQENPPPWLAKAMGKPSLGVRLYGERQEVPL